MEKLEKAYEAVDMLKKLGLPVSAEQIQAIDIMEKQYLREEVIPHVTKEIVPLVEQMHYRFRLEVTYSKEKGLDIVDKTNVQEKKFSTLIDQSRRQRKYIIRVVFPDNHVSCNKKVCDTLVDVIQYAGARNVMKLGITIMGDNLVSTELNPNEQYRVAQKEVEHGLYVCTFSTTEVKYEQIRRINSELNLGLKIEKVML